MNLFKSPQQIFDPIDKKQVLVRDVFLSDLKEIVEIYRKNKRNSDLRIEDDFGIPVRIVEINRRIVASLSLVPTDDEVRGVIRSLEEFEDSDPERLLVEDFRKKTASEAIVVNNVIFPTSSEYRNIPAVYGFAGLPAFRFALSRLIRWLNF